MKTPITDKPTLPKRSSLPSGSEVEVGFIAAVGMRRAPPGHQGLSRQKPPIVFAPSRSPTPARRRKIHRPSCKAPPSTPKPRSATGSTAIGSVSPLTRPLVVAECHRTLAWVFHVKQLALSDLSERNQRLSPPRAKLRPRQLKAVSHGLLYRPIPFRSNHSTVTTHDHRRHQPDNQTLCRKITTRL